jgi:hypothetical protein
VQSGSNLDDVAGVAEFFQNDGKLASSFVIGAV